MNCKKSILYKYNRFLFAYFTIIIIKNDRILLYFKKSESEVNVCLRKKKEKIVCSLWKLVRDRTFIQWREASPTLWKSSFPVVEQDAITQPFFLTCRSPLGKSTQRRAGFRDREPVLFLFVTRNNHLFHPGIHNFLLYRVPSYCTKILLTL